MHTVEEALAAAPRMTGMMTKNIFARDGSGKRHFLIIVPFNKRIDLAELARFLEHTGHLPQILDVPGQLAF